MSSLKKSPWERLDPRFHAARDAPSRSGPTPHAWKVIWGSFGLQLAGYISLSIEATSYSGYVVDRASRGFWMSIGVLLGAVLGVLLGAVVDHRVKNRPPRSRIAHLFMLTLQFALLFAIVRQLAALKIL